MAAKKGRGLFMVFTDIPPEYEEEFNRWYDEEHIPERLAIPGILDAARYVAVRGGPKYLACYEIAGPETRISDAWQDKLNNPTEWTRRISGDVIGTYYVHLLYRLIYPSDVPEETAQAGMAPVLLVGRMSVPPELEAQFNGRTTRSGYPLATGCPAISAAAVSRRCWASPSTPRSTRWSRCKWWKPPNGRPGGRRGRPTGPGRSGRK